MGRKRSRASTLLRLSPLYVLSIIVFYVLVLMDKDFDYLSAGQKSYASRDYGQALHYLDTGMEKKLYKGSDLLTLLLLRANTFNALNSYNHALKDLDKIIQLSPNSTTAEVARSLRGSIFLAMGEYKSAIEIFEVLAREANRLEEGSGFPIQVKAGAAAFNYSRALLAEIRTILDRLFEDYSPEYNGVNRFVTELHQDHDQRFLAEALAPRISVATSEQIKDLAVEANEYYRYAYAALADYPKQGTFDPLASMFLINILYGDRQFLPAIFECSVAMMEPLLSNQRRAIEQIMANIYWDLEAFDEAADIYESISKKETSNHLRPELLRSMVFARLKAENYDQVIPRCEKMLTGGLNDLVIKYCLGTAYLRKGHTYKAIPLLSALVQAIKTGATPPYFNKSSARKDCFLRLAEAYGEVKSNPQALATLTEGLRFFPEDFELRNERAALYRTSDSNPAMACEDCYFLLQNGPRDPVIFESWIAGKDIQFQQFKGMTLHDRSRYLIDQLDRKTQLIGDDPKQYSDLTLSAAFPEAQDHPALRLAISEEMIRRGRRDQGKSILRMLVRAMPEVPEFAFKLGRIYLEEGKPDLALVEFNKVLERDPPDFESVRLSLICYSELGDFLGEGRFIQAMLEKDDPALTRWILGQRIFKKGDLEDFRHLYENSERTEDDIQIEMDLLVIPCYLAEGNFTKASQILDNLEETSGATIGFLKAKARYLLAKEQAPTAESDPTDIRDGEPAAAEEEEEEETVAATAPEVNEDAWTSAYTSLEALIEATKGMSDSLFQSDVEALCGFFQENNRPDLSISLLDDLKLLFPMSRSLSLTLSRAFQDQGKIEAEVDLILNHADSIEDYRWVFAVGLLHEEDLEIPRKLFLLDAEAFVERGELFLSLAGFFALKGDFPNAERNLAAAGKFGEHGRFTKKECDMIDFLTRMLGQYASEGLDTNPFGKKETVDETDANAVETEQPENDSAEATLEPKPDTQTESANPTTKDTPASRFQSGDLKTGENPAQSATEVDVDIMLDGLPLSQRYPRVLHDVQHLVSSWSGKRPEDMQTLRSLLVHFLLRRIPYMEETCLECAREVLTTNPAIGSAALYLIEQEGANLTAEENLEWLRPAFETGSEDFEVLRQYILTQAQVEGGIEDIPETLRPLRKASSNPFEKRLMESEIELNWGDPQKALQLLHELLAMEEVSSKYLCRSIPLLVNLDATPDITRTVSILLAQQALLPETIKTLSDYLKKLDLTTDEMVLLQMLINGLPSEEQPVFLTILANNYKEKKDGERVVELADQLIEITEMNRADPNALAMAIFTIGSCLEATDYPEKTLEIYQKMFLVYPENHLLLKRVADLAYKQDKIRLSAKYLGFYHIIRPWDFKATLALLDRWFFEIGEFNRGKELLKKYTRAVFRKDPNLVFRTQMANLLMVGRPEAAATVGLKATLKEQLDSPENLYMLGAILTFLNNNNSAGPYLARVREEYPDSEWSNRCDYFIGKNLERKRQRKKARK